LNRESVADNVRHSKADILFEEDNTLAMDILTADECLLGNKEQDDTILFGIIFKIVHKNKSAEVSYNFYSKSFEKSNNKVRTKTPSFERMIYVADLDNPGMAFVMIFSQEKGSRMLDDTVTLEGARVGAARVGLGAGTKLACRRKDLTEVDRE
jgi:hypothetical protein